MPIPMLITPKHDAVPFIVFFIVANPALFKMVRGIAGSWVASVDGCPTTAGLLLHALVFIIVMALIKKSTKKSKYNMIEEYEKEEQ